MYTLAWGFGDVSDVIFANSGPGTASALTPSRPHFYNAMKDLRETPPHRAHVRDGASGSRPCAGGGRLE